MSGGAGKAGLVALCAWLLAAIGIIALRFSGGLPIDTNIQSILPEQTGSAATRAAMDRSGQIAADRIAFLIGAADYSVRIAASEDLSRRLGETGLFESDRDSGPAIGRWLFANRHELLCETDPSAFTADSAAKLRQSALARVYGVGAPVTGDLLKADPFLLTLHLTDCLSGLAGGALGANETLITGKMTTSAYSMAAQSALVSAVDDWSGKWQSDGVTLARSGAVFHAAHAAASAKGEIALIGGASLVGVIALFWFVFRRGVNIIAVASLIGLAWLSGFAAALLVFETIHVLVLVFAAMLVGVVSDYAVHAMGASAAKGWADRSARLSHLARPMTISMLTTAAGFGGMSFLGVSLFQQFALFAVVGVITAWALVLMVLLPLDRAPGDRSKYMQHWQTAEGLTARLSPPAPLVTGLAVCLLALAAIGLWRGNTLDDVRQFQPRDSQLMQDDASVSAALGGAQDQIFMVSSGETLNAAKRAEEAAMAAAPTQVTFLARTRFDPSAERRRATNTALQDKLFTPYLAVHRAQLGLGQTPPATVVSAPLPDWLADLHVTGADGRHYLIAGLSNADGWAGPGLEGVEIVNAAAQYSSAFARYRQLAMWSLGAAALVAGLFVLLVYRNPLALSIVIAPFLAMVCGVLIPSALGIPVSFFSMAGAMVLFGVGVDYSAFLWESGRDGDVWTRTSVAIGAITTLLSMGALSLSATFPVRSFGITVAIGVLCALVFSVLPYRLGSRER